MNISIEGKLSLLRDSLTNLSKSYQEQINNFPDYVDVYDEVVSDFDNAFRLLPAIMEQRAISYEALIEILKCNNLIAINLSVTERQTDKSLENDEAWNLVRAYASNALNLL